RSCQSATRTLGIHDLDIGDLLSGSQTRHLLSPSQLQIIRESAERELSDQILLMEKDMPILATTTTIAPFLGLLGTVWGVMQAFDGMAVTGAPTLSTVAPGISAALLTTVVGLLVAIPTVVGYNLLSVHLRNHSVGMDNFVQELVGEFHHAYVREDGNGA
ncbi:MAG: MotA/TolQ/ExbB proton channel family protein, partial [Kiritimatiellia bacterium]